MARRTNWENQIGQRLRLRDLHVLFMVAERGMLGFQAALVPAGVARGTEKHGALIVVDAVNFKSAPVEIDANFRAD